MPDDTQAATALHERLATEEGRRAYAEEYGAKTMRATLKHVHSTLTEAVQAEGLRTADVPEHLQGMPKHLHKPKSSFSRAEKAQFFAAARDAGNDPNEAWQALDA